MNLCLGEKIGQLEITVWALFRPVFGDDSIVRALNAIAIRDGNCIIGASGFSHSTNPAARQVRSIRGADHDFIVGNAFTLS
jgi:hypothetical protein